MRIHVIRRLLKTEAIPVCTHWPCRRSNTVRHGVQIEIFHAVGSDCYLIDSDETGFKSSCLEDRNIVIPQFSHA